MSKLKALIVDDEPYNLLGLKIILKAADKYGVVPDLCD